MSEDLTIGIIKQEKDEPMEDCDDVEDRTSPDSCTVSSMSLSKKDKICLVCGDRALGYNFNAISCESCKAFFRRNAHKTIRGRCEGKCEITIESRSFCKRCRLSKCFTVGMRKDMILSDDQKKIRKQKIVINKLKKTGHIDDPDPESPVDVTSKLEETIKSHTLEDLHKCFPNLTERDLGVLVKLKEERDKQAAKSKLATEKLPSWTESQKQAEEVICLLPEVDQIILEELHKAHEQSSFLGNTQTNIKLNPHSTTELVNVAEGFVRRIIKVAKNIEFFKMVSKEDQIGLLKGAVVEIMMLRSAVNYDVNSESWSLNTMSCLKKPVGSDSSDPSPSTSSAASPADSSMANVEAIRAYFQSKGGAGLGGGGGGIASMMAGFSGAAGGDASALTSGKLAAIMKGIQRDPVTGETKISADLLKMGNSESQTLFLTYSKFIKSLMVTINGDLIILKLLIMLSLFSSDRQGLTECCKIEEIQECYARILQKYVNLRYPNEKTMFAQIIMKLTDLRNINEVHTKMLLKMKLDDIEPLLIEIFDLPS